MMTFVGKLHPLLVHLPIGFLLLGIILHSWESVDKRKNFSSVIDPIFFLGSIAATLSCLTGLQLMNGGEYDIVILERHRNTGITLSILSFITWYLYKKNLSQKLKHFIVTVLTIFIFITGHYGGTLTHGSGFISITKENEETNSIVNIQEAVVYKDLIHPILTKKCVACHGPEKMKGKLRLDTEAFIRKGGKLGNPVIKEAFLLKRILLPPDDEEHMPPKEKGQLTTDEISLIKWWINEGADFNAKVADMKKDAAITALLNKKTKNEEQKSEPESLPEVPKADEKIIAQLKSLGVSIYPISTESNLLNINLINFKDSSLQTWELFTKIAPQLFTINAERSFIHDEHLKLFENAIHLRRLNLKGTSISDNAFQTIATFKFLESLNISDTRISTKGLSTLKGNNRLRYLYIINIPDSNLAIQLANVEIIHKPFILPTLESDTTVVVKSN